MNISAKVGFSSEVGCTVIRGATGRRIDFLTENDNKNEILIKEWAQFTNLGSKLSQNHFGAKKFKQLIQDIDYPKNIELELFRGCYKRPEMEPKPMPHHFGPPLKSVKSGRYNFDNQPVLYLCNSRLGVYAECRNQKNMSELYCQKFLIKTENVRLADFSNPILNNYIHIVFDYAENGLSSGKIDDQDYRFSQAVAHLVKQVGYGGMIVPGVRGNRNHRYNNVVLFDPYLWRNWLCTECEPELIDCPVM